MQWLCAMVYETRQSEMVRRTKGTAALLRRYLAVRLKISETIYIFLTPAADSGRLQATGFLQ